MTSPDEIAELVRSHLAEEVVCEAMSNGVARVACLTPLDYPSGDGITVWIEDRFDGFVVTDFGESLTGLYEHPQQDHKALFEQVRHICRRHGLFLGDGLIKATVPRDQLADAVWRAATAAAEIAQVGVLLQPHRRRREREFVYEVESVLRERRVTVERETHLAGGSGHRHRATLYLPNRESVIEPIGAAGNWNQISTVYAKFGDLSRANGFRLYSLIDDRKEKLGDDLANLLVQVSDVVEWSRRQDWLSRVI